MFTKLIVAAVLLCASAAQAAQTVEVTSLDDVWPETVLGLYEHEGTYNGRDFYTNGTYDLWWNPNTWDLTTSVGTETGDWWVQEYSGEHQAVVESVFVPTGSNVGVLEVVVPEPTTLVLLAMAAVAVLVARRKKHE